MGYLISFISVILKLFIFIKLVGAFKINFTNTELLTDPWDRNIIYQETTSSFISDTISLHFSECYMIQIRKQAPTEQYIHSARLVTELVIFSLMHKYI